MDGHGQDYLHAEGLSMFWARLVLCSVLGLVLDALGQSYRDTGFWCVVGLFFALDMIGRIELQECLDDILKDLRRRRQQQLDTESNRNDNKD